MTYSNILLLVKDIVKIHWVPAIPLGYLDEASSWLRAGTASAVTVTWGLNQWVEDLSLPTPSQQSKLIVDLVSFHYGMKSW